MNLTAALVIVLLALTVLVEALAVAGMVVMRTTMQRLHFVAPASCVGPLLAGIAIAIGTHATPSQGAKGLIVALVMLTFSGVLSHETGRAISSRESGARR